MRRLATAFLFLMIISLAAPVADALATNHVGPPGAKLSQPLPTNTDLTQNEIAAWVQAVGSVLAILAAIFFGRQSYNHSVRVFEDEKKT
jgi:hypothetical protein